MESTYIYICVLLSPSPGLFIMKINWCSSICTSRQDCHLISIVFWRKLWSPDSQMWEYVDIPWLFDLIHASGMKSRSHIHSWDQVSIYKIQDGIVKPLIFFLSDSMHPGHKFIARVAIIINFLPPSKDYSWARSMNLIMDFQLYFSEVIFIWVYGSHSSYKNSYYIFKVCFIIYDVQLEMPS